jgi:outer membrane protein assembly factor BamB
LRSTSLSDGRIAIDSAGPKPTLWFIGPGGQITGSFGLEKPLEAPPVELIAGLVLPLPGRLRLVSSPSGVPAAEEQLSPLEGGRSAHWKSVERISDKDLVALDSRGRLSRVQYRTDPVRSLTEVRSKQLEKPCDAGLVVAGSKIVFSDVEGALHFLDATTFDPVAMHKLPSPAVGRLWTAGSLVLVETRDHQLAAFDANGPTKSLFAMPLGETGPSGSPAIIRGRLVIATRDGTVLSVDPTSGKVAGRLAIGQPLTGGVISADGRPVVATIDGSLCRVDSLLETPNKKP